MTSWSGSQCFTYLRCISKNVHSWIGAVGYWYGKAYPELQVLLLPACRRSMGLDSHIGLYLTSARSNSGKRTFAFQGVLCWNILPGNIRSISCPRKFRAAAVPFLNSY
eukprot:scpid109918/ scgid8495/ 